MTIDADREAQNETSRDSLLVDCSQAELSMRLTIRVPNEPTCIKLVLRDASAALEIAIDGRRIPIAAARRPNALPPFCPSVGLLNERLRGSTDAADSPRNWPFYAGPPSG